MADPILAKISELDELTSTDGADQLPIVDASEPNVTKKTKRVRMDKLRITTTTQIADGIVASSKLANSAVTEAKIGGSAVTSAKIADGAVTEAKLASIDKTLVVRLLANDEQTSLRTWTNEFLWAPSLHGLVIKEAYATLATPSTSGNVAVTVKNNNNLVTTLTIATNAYFSAAGTINSSYRNVAQFNGVSFQITSAGNANAKGLSVILVVGRAA